MSARAAKSKAKPARAPRLRIHPYLSRPLGERFVTYCAATGTTESAVVEAALKQYLDGTSDHALLMRRIDRVGRAFERVERDLGLLSEAFAVWVQIWFAHTPMIPASSRDAARREAAARFQQYIDYVATKVSGGSRFVDSLAKERLGDDAELSAIVESVEKRALDQECPGEG